MNTIKIILTEEEANAILKLKKGSIPESAELTITSQLYRLKVSSMTASKLTKEFLKHYDDGFLAEFLTERAAEGNPVDRRDLEEMLITAKEDGVF
jgi:hypothetical protein